MKILVPVNTETPILAFESVKSLPQQSFWRQQLQYYDAQLLKQLDLLAPEYEFPAGVPAEVVHFLAGVEGATPPVLATHPVHSETDGYGVVLQSELTPWVPPYSMIALLVRAGAKGAHEVVMEWPNILPLKSPLPSPLSAGSSLATLAELSGEESMPTKKAIVKPVVKKQPAPALAPDAETALNPFKDSPESVKAITSALYNATMLLHQLSTMHASVSATHTAWGYISRMYAGSALNSAETLTKLLRAYKMVVESTAPRRKIKKLAA